MRIDILTLFPGMFAGPFAESIVRRGIDEGLVKIVLHNIRDYARDKHHVVDDYPFGGGGGMLMKPEPVFDAVEAVRQQLRREEGVEHVDGIPVILLTPQGQVFNQRMAADLAKCKYLVLLCGHYEGFDERIREHLATHEISIGDYVLTGGELPAMVVADAVVRLIPGVLEEGQWAEDSHARGLLKYPEYTRPAEYRGWKAPQVLLSGDHAEIARWRREESIRRTFKRRPELLVGVALTTTEKLLLEEERRSAALADAAPVKSEACPMKSGRPEIGKG
ncbi:MAG: tRNA (guanosine(37)-N1)-methyltransferase TrmD [Chloroflexi bacterium]|nr:tRNA (guanosine(37)-N1)-methyltransferase TrmD [Chloroflexota bacterium]